MAGHCALAQLPRVADEAEPMADGTSSGDVSWQADFSLRAAPGHPAQPWLHLGAQAKVLLICQRCLAPVETEVTVTRDFRFVADERAAELEDESSEEDVLATSQRFDLRDLLQDELLMALPIVPMHAACPQPLVTPGLTGSVEAGSGADRETGGAAGDKPNPFAVLGRLKTRLSGPADNSDDDRGQR